MLSMEERKSMLKLARDTIYAKLHSQSLPSYKPVSSLLSEPRGAFVTIHRKGKLRGCIGYVEAIKPLWQTVQEMAISSAFQDPRFPSLSKNEYGDIDIEISVMSPVKKISNVDEIEVGTHGIIIKKGYQQGLLLPQVATAEDWDRDTFLQHTCYKAGLTGECWKEKGTEVFIFSAEVFSEKSLQ
jgi:AmmeMemoRadiSam system protein A